MVRRQYHKLWYHLSESTKWINFKIFLLARQTDLWSLNWNNMNCSPCSILRWIYAKPKQHELTWRPGANANEQDTLFGQRFVKIRFERTWFKSLPKISSWRRALPPRDTTGKNTSDETAKYHQPFVSHHTEHQATLDQINVHIYVIYLLLEIENANEMLKIQAVSRMW